MPFDPDYDWDDAYGLGSPKHPDFADMQFLKADRDRKRGREDAPLFRPPPPEKPKEDES